MWSIELNCFYLTTFVANFIYYSALAREGRCGSFVLWRIHFVKYDNHFVKYGKIKKYIMVVVILGLIYIWVNYNTGMIYKKEKENIKRKRKNERRAVTGDNF